MIKQVSEGDGCHEVSAGPVEFSHKDSWEPKGHLILDLQTSRYSISQDEEGSDYHVDTKE